MRVLGIDPGSRHTGFGVVEPDGNKMRLVEAGTISPKESDPLSVKLAVIAAGLREVIARTAPAHVAVESIFFAKSVKSAITLGHARGVALLSAGEANLELFEYAPTEVKQAIVGTGRADKDLFRF